MDREIKFQAQVRYELFAKKRPLRGHAPPLNTPSALSGVVWKKVSCCACTKLKGISSIKDGKR